MTKRNSTSYTRRPSYKKRPYPIKRAYKRKAFTPTRSKFSRKKSKKTTVATLAKRVTKLSKSVDQGLALLTTRYIQTGSITTVEGKQLTTSINLNNQGLLNDSLMEVPYFDSATNTIINIDASDNATTYQRDYVLKYMGTTVTLKNNYTTSVTLKAAIVRPKEDTSVTPHNAYLAGLIDIGSLPPDHILTKWSDSGVYTDMWTNIVMKKTVLAPGESCVLHADLGGLKYQPQTAEADSLQYRKDEKPAALMITVMGAHGHDSVISTEFSTLKGAVDYQIHTTRKWEYDAGLSIKRTVLITAGFQDTGFQNVGTIAAKPVAAYQNFDSSVF